MVKTVKVIDFYRYSLYDNVAVLIQNTTLLKGYIDILLINVV